MQKKKKKKKKKKNKKKIQESLAVRVKSQISSLAGKLPEFYKGASRNHAKLLMQNHKSRNEVGLLYKRGGVK